MGVRPSWDGRSLLYAANFRSAPLLVVPVAGGASTQLVACVSSDGFAPAPSGVYYAAYDSSTEPSLHVVNPSTRRDRVLGRLQGFWGDLAVSPDEKTILYTKTINTSGRRGQLLGADLMMIDNFE